MAHSHILILELYNFINHLLYRLFQDSCRLSKLDEVFSSDVLLLAVYRQSFLLFQKYTRTTDLDRHSFSLVLLLYFTFLILEFLKKIGHTGIANTKKWLDQAVFPCWSNYHTLAGE